MPYDARVVKVFLASPGDVSKERQAARDVLYEWNSLHSEDRRLVLLPIGWETHSTPEMGDRPQAIINKQVLKNCDLLVGMFWTRLGTPTGTAASGTVEEIEEHLQAGKPAMLYFSQAPVRLDSVDEQQYATLKEFKAECRHRGLVESYEAIEEFREKLSRQLTQTMIRSFPMADGADAQPAVSLPSPRLGDEARTLLLEAAADPHGLVLRIRDSAGLTISTNQKPLCHGHDPRLAARWERAIQELENLGLLSAKGYKREVFEVADDGYQVADHLAKTATASPPPPSAPASHHTTD
jgi:Domain of unknown function (DUF4062)